MTQAREQVMFRSRGPDFYFALILNHLIFKHSCSVLSYLRFFNDVFSNSIYIESNYKATGEQPNMIQKETTVAYFHVISRLFSRRTEENHDRPDRIPMYRTTLEPDTPRTEASPNGVTYLVNVRYHSWIIKTHFSRNNNTPFSSRSELLFLFRALA